MGDPILNEIRSVHGLDATDGYVPLGIRAK